MILNAWTNDPKSFYPDEEIYFFSEAENDYISIRRTFSNKYVITNGVGIKN